MDRIKGNDKRIDWIDIAKAIGICLVIIGHCPQLPDIFKIWIYSFHMPLFFFLSGVTFSGEKYSFATFTKKKVKTLLVPYALFCIIFLIKDFLSKLILNDDCDISKELLYMLLPKVNSYFNYFWFIICLFVSELLFYGIVEICKKSRNKQLFITLFCVVAFIIGIILSKFSINIYCYVEISLVSLIFICIGYLMKNELKRLNYFGLLFIIPSVVFSFINNRILNGNIMVSNASFGNPIMFIMTSFCGIFFIISFAQIFKSKFALFIGKNSLFIYCFHYLFFISFIYAIPSKVLNLVSLNSKNDIYEVLYSVIFLLFVLLVCSLLIPIYNKVLKSIINFKFRKEK